MKHGYALGALLLLIILLPSMARASAGPIRENPGADGQRLMPIPNEDIAIRSCRLTYDIRAIEGKMSANVRSTYRMANTKDAPVELLVAFVSSNAQDTPKITFRGEVVDVLATRSLPWNDSVQSIGADGAPSYPWGHRDFAFDAVMSMYNEGNVTPPSADEMRLEVTLFPLSFAAFEECEMIASYQENAIVMKRGRLGNGNAPSRVEFHAFLDPARYWKEIDDLMISVYVARGSNLLIGLPGFERDRGIYTAHYKSVPAKNLRIRIDPPIWAGYGYLFIAFVAVGMYVLVKKFLAASRREMYGA